MPNGQGSGAAAKERRDDGVTEETGRSDDLSESLRSLVSERATETYTALLEGRPIAGETGPAVEELVRAGLVGIEHASGVPFAYPPRLALTRAVHNATRTWLASAPNIDRLVIALDTLGPEPLPALDAEPSGMADPAERQRAMEALVVGATSELAFLQPYYEGDSDDEFESGGWTSTPDINTPQRVVSRSVYDERLFQMRGFERVIHEEVALGAEVRITSSHLPGFLLVVDERIAAFTPDPTGAGRISTETNLVAMLHMAFEAAWAAATPLQRSSALSHDLLTMLNLIGLGHNNRRIATMLGLHERTIRRRVNDLLDHFSEMDRAALVRHAYVAETDA